MTDPHTYEHAAIHARAEAAQVVAGANTVQALTDLIARTLERYGNADATQEGVARFDLITLPPGAVPAEEGLRSTFLAEPRTQQDVARRRAWLAGHPPVGDDLDEASALVCDALCALDALKADHNTIIEQIQEEAEA